MDEEEYKAWKHNIYYQRYAEYLHCRKRWATNTVNINIMISQRVTRALRPTADVWFFEILKWKQARSQALKAQRGYSATNAYRYSNFYIARAKWKKSNSSTSKRWSRLKK